MMFGKCIDLRKYEVVSVVNGQDGWKIEERKRQSGKLLGQCYKVFISPTDVKYYSLAKAIKDGGFKPSDTSEIDGRKRGKNKKA